MAKNTRHDTERSDGSEREAGGTWTRRSTSIGQFKAAKKAGGSFKGVRKNYS